MTKTRQTVLFFGDIVALILSLAIMAKLRFDVGAQGPLIWLQIKIFAVLFIIWLVVFFIFDLYNLRRINPNPTNIGLLIAAMAINGGLGIVTFYLLAESGISPKTNLAILVGSALVLLVCWRRLFYAIYTKHYTRSIGIIGTSPLITHLKEELARNPHIGTVIVHVPDINATDVDVEKINLLVTECIPSETLATFLQELDTEILSLTEAYETLFNKIPVSLMTEEKAIQIISHHGNKGIMLLTRVVEILVASVVLIITSPLVLIACIAIVMEDGSPIIIKQRRVGKNGKIFPLYKLRSMKALAPDGSAEINGVQWAEKSDPRITRVGKILRATHLDEVPQMVNILKGDLALIGPRAERPELVATLAKEIPYYFLRHTIRPGFTGWAQVKFRYARTVLEAQEKFEYDLYYLRNKSPLLDIGIFLKTVQILFTH